MQVYSLQPGMLLKRLYHRYFPADILKSLETACYPTLGTTDQLPVELPHSLCGNASPI